MQNSAVILIQSKQYDLLEFMIISSCSFFCWIILSNVVWFIMHLTLSSYAQLPNLIVLFWRKVSCIMVRLLKRNKWGKSKGWRACFFYLSVKIYSPVYIIMILFWQMSLTFLVCLFRHKWGNHLEGLKSNKKGIRVVKYR